MANGMAHGFAQIGPTFPILAPIVGWIGVALSGSNTSTNALFSRFQCSVGGLLYMPPTLLPSLNSVGAEIGKPIAPQTASVGVSTSVFVRREGQVLRHNLPWTPVLRAYLLLIALLYRGALPAAMQPKRGTPSAVLLQGQPTIGRHKSATWLLRHPVADRAANFARLGDRRVLPRYRSF
jgi:lactate permease